MAEQFGQTGEWGIATTQAGIISESTSYNYTSENKVVRNIDGEIDGKTYYAGQVEATCSGYIPSTSAWSKKVAESQTLSLTPDALSVGTTGTFVVESITQTYSNEDFARIEARLVAHDGL